jgi:glutaconate CoA-transferase subunit A
MSMSEAVSRFVRDGDTVYLGGFVQHEPYAAVHEIIRQHKQNLTISRCAGIIIVDLLVGAGCVDKVITSYVWNTVPKPAHAFKRAVEKGFPRPVEVEDYTVLTLTLAYFAGACDLPFIAAKTPLGSDIVSRRAFRGEDKFKVIDSPFTGEKVCLIPPLKHDVGIIQIQRADTDGNGQAWGVLGDSKYGINSCQKVILCVEEIVNQEVIRKDPNRTIIPGFKVCAVVEEPWGGHPSYVTGYYDLDWPYFLYYDDETRTPEGFAAYLDKWVYSVKNRQEYLKSLGEERLQKLKAGIQLSGQVNYGKYKPWGGEA